MAWYDTGTVAVTNGSTIVTGTGTNFIVGAQVGEAFYGPDSKLYEIQTITSATVMVLADAYLGSTQSGQAYQIVPTQSLVADLAVSVTDLISDFADVRDYAGNGKFNDGAVGTPGITFTQDQDNGLYRIGANNWALAAGGQKIVDVSTSGISLPDNGKATFGASDDLQIYHDGSHSQIKDVGTGNLYIKATSGVLIQDNDTGTNRITTSAAGPVYVYHAGNQKLATTSTGIDVTGTATMDGLTVGSASGVFPSEVLQIRGNGGASGYINGFGIGASNSQLRVFADDTNNTLGSIKFDIRNRDRILIQDTGDISFYEDTGTTAKFFWDASAESLGIGTSSPDSKLHITSNSTADFITLEHTSGPESYIQNSSVGSLILSADGTNTGASSRIEFKVDNTERMRIDSAGNVGIGTSSPTYKLSIGGAYQSVNTDLISITDTATVYRGTPNGAGFEHAKILSGRDASTFTYGSFLSFYTEGKNSGTTDTSTERMRIDSAGNLMVGRTSASGVDTDGHVLFGNGVSYQSNTDNAAQFVNRNGTTDGSITSFYKNGTTVGSIGSSNGDLTLGNSDVGLKFHDTNNTIYPWNVSSDAASDGQLDLGAGSIRFKDLYLSGGVYLGGTGAANKLDDYEEGTWTPVLGGGATATGMTGKYTKVGNLVTAYLILENSTISGTPDYIVSGLPFTSAANRTALSVTYLKTFNTACESLGGFVGGNSTSMEFLGMVQGGNWLAANLTAGTGRYVYATAVYQTS